MAEFDSAIALAKRLIERKGRLMTFQRRTTTASDQNAPWDVEEEPTPEHEAKAVVFPVEQKYVDGSTIRTTDKQMYVAAASLGVELTLSFTVKDRGQNLEIVGIEPLEPGEQRIMYTVFVR